MAIARDYSSNTEQVMDNPDMGREMQEVAQRGKGIGYTEMYIENQNLQESGTLTPT
jgi:hypothetical protein